MEQNGKRRIGLDCRVCEWARCASECEERTDLTHIEHGGRWHGSESRVGASYLRRQRQPYSGGFQAFQVAELMAGGQPCLSERSWMMDENDWEERRREKQNWQGNSMDLIAICLIEVTRKLVLRL
jgi:hypothetical protein